MDKIEPIHPNLNTIAPYNPPDLSRTAARAGVEVEQLMRLDANENPLGPSPKALEALAAYDGYAFYPEYEELREAVARYADAAPEQVVLGNGADELIDLLIRLFAEPGQTVLTCPPTFSMYSFFAKVNRCRVLAVPRRPDFSIDAAAIEAALEMSETAARLLFLVSPGNPDGQAIPLEKIQRLLALPLLVAVDETYIEFGGESALSLLPDHDNLVIIRTFSKWAGLAGLRLGYALLAPRWAAQLKRICAPYNVNAAAIVTALATLEDMEPVRANIARLIAERVRLQESLTELDWLEPLPSQANFILCGVKNHSPREVAETLAQEGILIRRFSAPSLAGYIRISVGRPEQNDALLETLRRIGK